MQSHFALLNLKPRFALPQEELDAEYRAVAARVHPDRHATADATQRREAQTLAADVNEAYGTLRRASSRAQHLLQLRGVDPDSAPPRVAPQFLTQQMQWRESLAEAAAERNLDALRMLRTTVGESAADLRSRLEVQLDVLQDNTAAAHSVQELLFIEKLSSHIQDAEAALED